LHQNKNHFYNFCIKFYFIFGALAMSLKLDHKFCIAIFHILHFLHLKEEIQHTSWPLKSISEALIGKY